MVTEAELLAAIQEHYVDATISVRPDPKTGRLTGTVISAKFEGMGTDDREIELWRWLFASFGFDATTIGKLSARTPGENAKGLRRPDQ